MQDAGPDDAASDPVFRDVDASAADSLVAMMDATDSWPAVQAARRWIVSAVGDSPLQLALDVGSGPGTFNAELEAARTVDLDRSSVMSRTARSRHAGTSAVQADAHALPLPDGTADLVHVERMLQWLDRPEDALDELLRVAAPGGWVAATDTDWGTFRVHPSALADQWTAAALAWVPHSRLAASLPEQLERRGLLDVRQHHAHVVLTHWDPAAPDQGDGPPGLPLRTIARIGDDPVALLADVDRLADAATIGRLHAELTLVTAVGRLPTR